MTVSGFVLSEFGEHGHLLSIGEEIEMIFIHFMLTTRWEIDDSQLFIGNCSNTFNNNVRIGHKKLGAFISALI